MRLMTKNICLSGIMAGIMAVCVDFASMYALAATEVSVDSVTSGDPWSKITVNYTLSGVDAVLDYKVAFDVTANGIKRGVTNSASKLENKAYSMVIDTVALFGVATTDPKAKVGVSLIAVNPQLGGVQLWENGPYWAECNVGASKPEECGYYFWWGDTIGYKRNADNTGWVSVKDETAFSFDYAICPTYCKDNASLQAVGYIDSTGNLVAANDAATAHLGAPWRMPTDAEIQALISNCTTTWITTNGVMGRLVTGKGAYVSKSIFLPAAGLGIDSGLYDAGSCGHYWSSTPISNVLPYSYSWLLNFYSSSFDRSSNGRSSGQSVRPIRGFAQ